MKTSIRVRDNAIAYVALFFGLGGTGAWAAGAITSKDIARNAVGSKHIKAGGVGNADLADGAVTGTANGVAFDGDGDSTAGGAYLSPADTVGGGAGQVGLYRLFGAPASPAAGLRNLGLNLAGRLPVLKNLLMRHAMR